MTNGSTFMIAEGFNIYYLGAIAAILPVLAAIIASKKHVGSFHGFLSGASVGIFQKTEPMNLLTLKKCPECAEPLSLSALLCDKCDYNFLSGSIAHRHKLLPPPSEALGHDV